MKPARAAKPRGSTLVAEVHAAKRRAVLDAAADVLVRHGPDGFNVRDVAKTVGASTMVIYTLFGGRDGLLEELGREGLERLAAALARVPKGDTLGTLGNLARAYRRFALANRQYYYALFAGRRPGTSPLESKPFELLVGAVQRCMDRGVMARIDPVAVADSLWGLVHGMVSLELGGHFPSTKAAEQRFLMAGKAMLNGFRARSAVRGTAPASSVPATAPHSIKNRH